MSKINSITINGYKSIQSIENLQLNNLNVLIGANGAGKSNFISIFKLLTAILNQELSLYVEKQGSPDALLHFGRKYTDKISIKLCFEKDNYNFNLIPTNDNRLVLFEEQADFKTNAQTWRIYHFHDTSETANVKRIHKTNDNLQLKADAENLAAYLRMIYLKYPAEYLRIIETIRLVLPFFHDFVHRKDENLENIELEWFQVGRLDTPLKAHLLSDGSLRFICLITLLLQPLSLLPDTILIDEPELGLHPYAISILADVIKQVAEEKQLIISTQSVELVNEFSPNDIIVVEQNNGVSSFKRLLEEDLKDWLEDYALGELWKRNIFGGRP